ncbi:MAG: response regulator transcription factor [Chloroflexi bacterium]|nr:response regulator transcription factor [Chloroflexota bacterium]MBI3761542.1 response regulator transcription factor [Chloroflexota bacterium]
MISPIRVLIVDDHPVVRHGLRSLLAGHPDLEVVGEAENGAEVIPFLTSHETDVILLDIQMKGQSGIEIARRVRRTNPGVRIIVLTTYDDESYLHEALEAGVHGFLLKSVSHESLPDSIRAVMRGERLLSPSLVTTVVSNYQTLAQEQARREAGLTAEELQVLAAIAGGASNKDVAERFYWSEATAKRRVQDILEKMGASSRTQAIAEAVRRGWI